MILIDSNEPEWVKLTPTSLNTDGIVVPLPSGDILIPPKEFRGPLTASRLCQVTNWSLPFLKKRSGLSIPQITRDPHRALREVWGEEIFGRLSKEGMLIERKTVPDLLSSIADGRLMDQGRRVVEASKFPVLLIDGVLSSDKGMVTSDGGLTQWNINSVTMYLFSLSAGGMLLTGGNGVRLSEMLRLLTNWLDKDEHLLPGRRPALPFLNPSTEMEVLTCFPGVGPETGRNILAYCGDLKSALAFLSDPKSVRLKGKPKGVGKKVIHGARQLMGLEEGEVLIAVMEDTHG